MNGSIGAPIGAHVSIAGGLPNAIEKAVKIGAQCIQIFSSSPGQWNGPSHKPELINKFIDQKRKHEVNPVFIHAKYLVNLVSDKRWLAEQSVRSLIADLNFASEIGAVGVIVHLGSHLGKGYGTVQSELKLNIKKILKETPHQTQLIIEDSAGQKGKLSSKLEEIADTVNGVDSARIALCLDTCHLFAAGYDIRQKAAVDKLADLLKNLKLLERLVVIHTNDAKDPLGSGRDRHENIGNGMIGIKGMNTFITQPEFLSLPKILEVPGFDDQGPDAANIKKLQALFSGSNFV